MATPVEPIADSEEIAPLPDIVDGTAGAGASRGVAGAAQRVALHRRPVLFPNVYVWFVFLGALDIMLTWLILHPVVGGSEVNVIAQFIIEHGGLAGTLLFKFGIVLGVVLICEIVGRRDLARGRRLAEWAVAITSIPVIVAVIQLAVDLYGWWNGWWLD